MDWDGRLLKNETPKGGKRARGNKWPERKKIRVITTYKRDHTSKKQKQIMPIKASKKNPTTKPKSREAAYAAIVAPETARSAKNPRHRKNNKAYGKKEVVI